MMTRDATTDQLFVSSIDQGANDNQQPEQEEGWNEPFSSGYQPIIGIPIPVQQGIQGPLLIADAVGGWAIERMHGRVFLIPLWPLPTHPNLYQSLWSLMQSMDGLFLPAGIQEKHWYSAWKTQEPESDYWSTTWEMALIQLATVIGMPILAIGDGTEKWNSALGGTPQDGANQMAPSTPETWDHHTIRVRAQSKLAEALQPAITAQGNEPQSWSLSFMSPHQGMEQVAPGLRSCAQADDGKIAAYERTDDRFGLGITGRLDWGLDHIYATALFDAFLQASQSFDQERQHQQGWESARDTICSRVADLVAHDQPLISTPSQHPPSSPSFRSPPPSQGQKRTRQRSEHPTKEALNNIRRQRLKGFNH